MLEPAFYRVSVKALIRDEQGRILLARQSDGKWELLGGGLEHGEEPRLGLEREIAEECGLTAVSVAEHPSYFTTMRHRTGKSYYANVVYEVVLKDLDFTPSEECVELRFVTAAEARLLDLQENVQKLLDLLEQQ